MKNTVIVIERTKQEMLNHKERAYNPSEWDKAINRKYERFPMIRFFEALPDENFAYSRFFIQYELVDEGLKLMSRFSAYSASLTSNGFVRAILLPLSGENMYEIFTRGFNEDGKACVKNTKEGRKWIVDNLSKYGVYVTTSI